MFVVTMFSLLIKIVLRNCGTNEIATLIIIIKKKSSMNVSDEQTIFVQWKVNFKKNHLSHFIRVENNGAVGTLLFLLIR